MNLTAQQYLAVALVQTSRHNFEFDLSNEAKVTNSYGVLRGTTTMAVAEHTAAIILKAIGYSEIQADAKTLRLRSDVSNALIAGRHWHGGSNNQLVSTITQLCKVVNGES